jgi:hypothetical protein
MSNPWSTFCAAPHGGDAYGRAKPVRGFCLVVAGGAAAT